MIKPEAYNPTDHHFPNTAFVDEVAQDAHPMGRALIRSVYLAQFFGQADGLMTDYFTREVVITEPETWSSEDRRHYPDAYRSAKRFFEDRGAIRLAEASTPADGLSADDLSVARGIKEDFLQRSWRLFSEKRPTNDAVQHAPDLIEEARKHYQTGFSIDKTQHDPEEPLSVALKGIAFSVGILWRFVELDRQQVLEGRRPGMYVQEPHESIVREAVLARSRHTTGSAAFNLKCAWLQDSMYYIAAPEVRRLGKAWRKTHRHTRQEFMPEEFANIDHALMPKFGDRLQINWLARPLTRFMVRKYIPDELR